MATDSLSIEIRDGAVEESESSEGDDMGLRVLVGRRSAVVSTNDMSDSGTAALAERAVAMARVAPDDKYAGLADESELAIIRATVEFVKQVAPTVERLAAAAFPQGLEPPVPASHPAQRPTCPRIFSRILM